jgi:16S rRNA (adenine1518-N6/adenine1519-N6)-dimethyltransferase
MKKSRRKALGQHFLSDRGVLRKILSVINPQRGELIVEIGAGKGALTFLLAKSGAKIFAIEKDREFIPFLRKEREFPNIRAIEKDILDVDLREIAKKDVVKLVGNLPYSISSPLLFKILEDKESISSCVFLLQREVAERLCASPGSKKYSPLSILFQNDFSTRLHFVVSPEAFSPPPRVESALISLKKRLHPLFPIPDRESFMKFLKGAFQQRRKKLVNNLKGLSLPHTQIRTALKTCGIEDIRRPEEVSLLQFVKLFGLLYGKQTEDPPRHPS